MSQSSILTLPHHAPLKNAADRAARAIPPLWPLYSSVAVNPFWGQSDLGLSAVAARLARVAGASVTMPRSWYLKRISAGTISDADLLAALARAPVDLRPPDVAALKAAASCNTAKPQALPSIAQLSAEVSGIDWPRLIAERFGAWAAGYFDEGQALWAAPRGQGAYGAWRATAINDLTPEIAGLSGFSLHISNAPESAAAVLARVTDQIGLKDAALETYFHQMLITLGGWAQYARGKLWRAELQGERDDTIIDLLAIRLLWEEALYLRYQTDIAERWAQACAGHAMPVGPTSDMVTDVILQEAAENAAHRALALKLSTDIPNASQGRPAIQAFFCIDVRSEIFRRALESLSPHIQTSGFAGFFGIATSHRRLASDVEELRLPVLLNHAVKSRADSADHAATGQSLKVKARAARAWGRFKLAAVSSFAFIEAAGPIYLGKLIGDALGVRGGAAKHEPAPQLDQTVSPAARARMAETILRAMSLTADFARLILLTGHGANVVNNPHASGLHCGACGGYPGDVNARLLATLLNDPNIRANLALNGIHIPADTLFLAALHDTTTDHVALYAEDCPSGTHQQDIEQAKAWLDAAGKIARAERALNLPHATSDNGVALRSRDWSETRPEWALAGCKAFIAAPRLRTARKNLEGRAFLHDYNWKQDRDFQVLELILTAPVVVASWISLQYYGSVVAPGLFGAGNKLLHNVTGGIGVVEGNGGLLRAGLPWQSIHDGQDYAHEPLRLCVCVEAPRQAMSDILKRHHNVRELFDNGWLSLFALDDKGRMAWRYAGGLDWTCIDECHESGSHKELKVLG